MTHHDIIREEMEHAVAAVAQLDENIQKLQAQRDRFAAFVATMQHVAALVPAQSESEQLEFDFDGSTEEESPENIVAFKQ